MDDRRKKSDRRGGPQAIFPADDRQKERRRVERRIKDRIPVKMWIRNIDGNANYFQQTGNLSASGMYILSPNPCEAGSEISLEFQVPGTEHIVRCTALVVNLSPEEHFFGLSVKFTQLDPKDRKIIEKAIENLISEYWYLIE